MDPMERISILAAFNSNYFMPAIVMFKSLLTHHPNADIHIMYSDLKENELSFLSEYINKYDEAALHVYHIDEKQCKDFPVRYLFSIETYYRLFASEYLPKELDRILWLDADIIINNPINQFYHQNLGSYYFAACEDVDITYQKHPEVYKRLELPEDCIYINAGVLLINLKQLRKINTLKMVYEYIAQNSSKLEMLDQDVINALFYEQILIDDWHKYNCNVYMLNEESLIKKARNEASILHYTWNKPWKYNDLALGDIWDSYYSKSPLGHVALKRLSLKRLKNLQTKINR